MCNFIYNFAAPICLLIGVAFRDPSLPNRGWDFAQKEKNLQ